MSLFRCPVCKAPLAREARAYACPSGHSYDLAREGYAYLLPPNQKHSAAPGDDRRMAQARRDFLSKGYYAPLLNTLCCQILSLCGESPVILDAGCGEGYYTAGIFQALEKFRRVLRLGGAFWYVVPGANHLWELKQGLYDHPYSNEESVTASCPLTRPFFHALPYHFLRQTAEYLPKCGLPPQRLANRTVIRHSFIQSYPEMPTKHVAVRAPRLDLPLRGDAVQESQQQVFCHHHRVYGRPYFRLYRRTVFSYTNDKSSAASNFRR